MLEQSHFWHGLSLGGSTNFKPGAIMENIKGLNWFLYFTACIVNLTTFTCGVATAWSSPVVSTLQSPTDSPVNPPLTEDEVSWVVSLLPLGAVIAPYAAGYSADKIGRRRTLILSAIPTIASFLILAFVRNVYWYYIARFILGITTIGTPLTVVPMFIGEVSQLHNRGTLGCFTILYVTLGFLFSLAVGPFVSFQNFNLLCLIAPTSFFIVFTLFIPETPVYYIMKNNLQEAKRSLTKLRVEPIDKEILNLENTVKSYMASKGGIRDVIHVKSLRKAVSVTMSLMVIQQMTAMSVMTFYMQLIFETANSTISADIAAIIIGIVQVFGSLASTITVEKLGRKPLLLASTILTSLTLFIFSIYFYLLVSLEDLSNFGWLPLVTMIVYRLAYGFGIGSLVQTLLSEIFPSHIKSVASALTISTCFSGFFIVSKVFPLLVRAIGNWFAFLVFAVCNTAGVVYIRFMVPETKGRTLAEIVKSFE